ncbi:MAG TPA: GNAT family N-acetyltransferase [Pyrinomonadaceae bacterium]|nr:GNAT family N-acetyltransferase [Pyrinomonadaceae bacterium]
MSTILETAHLILREWTQEDADAAFRLWGDAEVMRHVGQPFSSVEVAQRALGNAIAAQEKHGFCLWAAVEKSSGRVVGCCGFHPYDGGAALELAYHFVPSTWGRGYATEAADACLKYGFERLRARRIVALTHPANVASARVLEKIGMSYVGVVSSDSLEERLYEAKRTGE